MNFVDVLAVALRVLRNFPDSSLYDDYQEADGFTDAEYQDMVAALTKLKELLAGEEQA